MKELYSLAYKISAMVVGNGMLPPEQNINVEVSFNPMHPNVGETIHSLYSDPRGVYKFYEEVDKLDASNVDQRDSENLTLFQKAIYNGQVKLTSQLLAKGANILDSGPRGVTFLRILSESSHTNESEEIFKLLLSKRAGEVKACIQSFDSDALEPILRRAIETGNLGFTTKLCENLDRTVREEFIHKLMDESIQGSDTLQTLVNDILILEKRIQDIDNGTNDPEMERTKIALKNAEIRLKDETLKYTSRIALLYKVYGENDRTSFQYSNLKKAIESSDVARYKILLQASDPRIVNIKDKDDNTLLNLSFSKISEIDEKIRAKLALQNVPNIKNEDLKRLREEIEELQKKSSLLYKIAQTTIENEGFDFNKALEKNPNLLEGVYIASRTNLEGLPLEDKFQRTKLFDSLFVHKNTKDFIKGNKEQFVNLLKSTAKYNDPASYFKIYNIEGITHTLDSKENSEVLFYAAQSGCERIFNNIFENTSTGKVDTSKKLDFDKKTKVSLLMAACNGGNIAIIDKVLSTKLANVNDKDILGHNALHYLAKSKSNDNIAIINKLVEEGIDINAQNNLGHSPLISAILLGNGKMVQELLARGADINIADKDGDTALIHALKMGDKKIINAILSYNEVDISHRNKAGISAYLIALSMSNQDQDTLNKSKDFFTKEEYRELSKTLLRKGADPYQVSPTSLLDLAAFTTLAFGVNKAVDLISTVKDPYGVAQTAGAILKTPTRLITSYFTFKKAKSYFRGKLDAITTTSDQKISLKDEVMIGSMHRGRILGVLPRITRGATLQHDMSRHHNFNDSEHAVFDVDSLSSKIEEKKRDSKTFLPWVVRSQLALQDRYLTCKRQLDNISLFESMILGRVAFLKANLDEIKKASEILIDKAGIKVDSVEGTSQSQKTFEQLNEALVTSIDNPTKRRALMAKLIANNDNSAKTPELTDIDNLIGNVVSRRIMVAPETFYNFCEFDRQRKQVIRNSQSKAKFIQDNNGEIDINSLKLNKDGNNTLERLAISDTKALDEQHEKTTFQKYLDRAKDITAKHLLPPRVKDVLENTAGTLYAGAVETINDPSLFEQRGKIASLAGNTMVAISHADQMMGSPVRTILSVPLGVVTAAIKYTPGVVMGAYNAMAENHMVAATVAGVAVTAAAAYYFEPWKWFKTKTKTQLTELNMPISYMKDLSREEVAIGKDRAAQSVISSLWNSIGSKKPAKKTFKTDLARSGAEKFRLAAKKDSSALSEKITGTPPMQDADMRESFSEPVAFEASKVAKAAYNIDRRSSSIDRIVLKQSSKRAIRH